MLRRAFKVQIYTIIKVSITKQRYTKRIKLIHSKKINKLKLKQIHSLAVTGVR